MIQKFIGAPKDELQIIFRLYNQPNIDHDVIVFWCIKCSFLSMFILAKDESNILILAFWHCVWPLKIVFKFHNVNFFLNF